MSEQKDVNYKRHTGRGTTRMTHADAVVDAMSGKGAGTADAPRSRTLWIPRPLQRQHKARKAAVVGRVVDEPQCAAKPGRGGSV